MWCTVFIKSWLRAFKAPATKMKHLVMEWSKESLFVCVVKIQHFCCVCNESYISLIAFFHDLFAFMFLKAGTSFGEEIRRVEEEGRKSFNNRGGGIFSWRTLFPSLLLLLQPPTLSFFEDISIWQTFLFTFFTVSYTLSIMMLLSI